MKRYFRPEEEPLYIKIMLYGFQLFCVFSVFYSIFNFKAERGKFVLISVSTIFICLAPWLVQRWLHVKFSNGIKVMTLLISVSCALLGHVYKFYHIVPGYDKILHAYFGFLFTSLGSMIPAIAMRRSKYKPGKAFCLLCAVMAVMTCSAIWELVEFLFDNLLNMDMQRDTVLKNIYSYNLGGGERGVLGGIENIKSVVINGKDIVPVTEGYLDIGLFDSMFDMLAAGVGTGIFALLTLIKKGKYMKWAFPEVLPWDRDEYFKAIGYTPKKKAKRKK